MNDPVLLDLFEKLGPACANVDEASAIIRNAAGRVESEAITIRNKNEPDGGRWAESSGDSARATT